MRFRVLLWLLGLRLWWLSLTNQAFREQLAEQDNAILQFETALGDVSRYFTFSRQRVASRSGLHADPDLRLIFKTAPYAFNTLMAAGKHPTVFMQGVQSKDITSEGNASLLVWFIKLMKHIAPGSN